MSAESRGGIARVGLARLPAYALIVVALVQMSHAAFGNLSPWVGGGFGMFSTMNSGLRVITARGVTSGGDTVTLRLPTSTESLRLGWSQRSWLHLMAAPTESELDRLAESILASSWVDESLGGLTPIASVAESGLNASEVVISEVCVEVFGLVFSATEDLLLRAPLLSVVGSR